LNITDSHIMQTFQASPEQKSSNQRYLHFYGKFFCLMCGIFANAGKATLYQLSGRS